MTRPKRNAIEERRQQLSDEFRKLLIYKGEN